ncbi:hypothetical protein L6V77_22355 [Myxococcota bacterium]|nr:hypothetical protein [Myxococcota bacterium]
MSDVHLTVPHPWAAFRDQVEFGRFLNFIAEEPRTTLVLAGDTFDFLMLEGYEGFDAALAPDRLAVILKNEVNAPVLAGLRAVVARGHRIVLLAGNHDPEVLLPTVRGRFADLVGMALDALGGDQRLYDPADGRAPIWGHRIEADGQIAFVVHGDRWDISNYIDREALLAAVDGGEEVVLPPGSRLVYRAIRRLKGEGHGWADQVKPEIASVIPLLLYLDWELAWDVLKSDWGVTANLLTGLLRYKLDATNLEAGASQPGVGGPAIAADLTPMLGALRSALSDGDQDAILRTLQGAQVFAPARPAPGGGAVLAPHSGFWRWLLRAWLIGVRDRSRFFDATSPDDELVPLAEATLPPGLDLLVAGHTHGRRFLSVPGRRPPLYVNSGTWTPVGPLPEGDMATAIDAIERGGLPTATSPRSVVEIRVGAGLEARLRTWQNGALR